MVCRGRGCNFRSQTRVSVTGLDVAGALQFVGILNTRHVG